MKERHQQTDPAGAADPGTDPERSGSPQESARNQQPEDSAKARPEARSEALPEARDEVAGAVAAPGKRRSRRSTAAPATLRRAAELIQSAPAGPRSTGKPPGGPGVGARPAQSGRQAGRQADRQAGRQAGRQAEAPGNTGQSAGAGNTGQSAGACLPRLAREDDPRAWGDQPDDSAQWLREQRPPHWG
ncbi:hypothetical protein [Arthrobacter luteolus]|uniref:hypothetical protein n=1 Tax=Arthrobacter luteolus TaxID=98672 RepID=UPI00082A6FA9|nr:hypothetical protein [Arthrobacter luteolus]